MTERRAFADPLLPRVSDALGHHVMLRLEDDRVIARTPAERRAAARIVYEQGESRGLIAFAFADSHLHVLLACDRVEAGRFARYVAVALRSTMRIPVRFARSRIKKIADQHHLASTYRYILRQEARHGTDADPFRDGSHVPDCVGARVLLARSRRDPDQRTILGQETMAAAARLLPRIRTPELVAQLGGEELLSAAPAYESLADAAAAAFGLGTLDDPDGIATIARRAAIHAAVGTLGPARVAILLGVSTRTVRRQARRSIPPAFVRAVGLQLRFRGLRNARIARETTAELGLEPEHAAESACGAAGWRASRSDSPGIDPLARRRTVPCLTDV
jgi:hypothetical protein